MSRVAHAAPATRTSLWLVGVGLAMLAVTWALALGDSVARWEEDVFRSVNGWPDWLETPMWPVMQLGAAAVIPVVTGATYLAWRRRDLAVAVFTAGGAAWLLAKVVKAFVERGRPGALLDDVILRPEWTGLGFVSGHAAVAFAMATILSPHLPRPWRALVWVGAVLTGLLRMYTAAHLPLDVVGGAGLGLALAGLIRVLVPAIAGPRA